MSSEVTLKFLGTGSIVPNDQRSCSSALLETHKERILLDIGCGTLCRISVEQIDIQSIEYVFITHFHPDHIGDLIPFLFALRNVRSNHARNKLQVWAPRGFKNFIKGMEMAYGRWIRDSAMNAKYNELGRRLLDFPGFRVIWDKVVHASESVGYRFEIGGKVIAFSGDSGYCQELVRLCQKADIAVLECSHADEYAVEGHLSPSLAAKIAEQAGARKMVLTHFYPDALKSDIEQVAAKFYRGEIILAKDGMKLSLAVDEDQAKSDNK